MREPTNSIADLIEHLSMLDEGVKLVQSIMKECHSVIKSNAYDGLVCIYRRHREMNTSDVGKMLVALSGAMELFDAIEVFWKEQNRKRLHRNMLITESLFQYICSYMADFLEIRRKVG